MRSKLLLLVAAIYCAIPIFAQDIKQDSLTESFKPKAKSISTELNVNPFNGSISLNNSLNQIKVRYFTKADLALRLGLNVNANHSLSDYNYPYSNNNTPNYKTEESNTTIALNFGLEKHLKGSNRVSPYIGADLSLENLSSSQEITNGQITTKIKNGTYQTIYNNNNGFPVQQLVAKGYFKYGLNIFSGFDFYMAKNFFFGYEFNLGFTKTDYKNPDLTVTGAPNSQTITDVKSTNFSFGPTLMNGIRVGYIF